MTEKETKFKEGDKVKIINGSSQFKNIKGKVVEVCKRINDEPQRYLLKAKPLSGAFKKDEDGKKVNLPQHRYVYEEMIEQVKKVKANE